jgi:hypothetical protein
MSTNLPARDGYGLRTSLLHKWEASPVFRTLGPKPAITQNERAPLYSTSEIEQQVLYEQALRCVESGQVQDSDKELIKQTALVSLFFFLRYVASYSGPYESLTPDLHLDMANWYQLRFLPPGSKCAGFIFRGGFKSTEWTHGANAWEIVRDPEIEIIQASNIKDRSEEFLEFTQSIFRDNEFFAWLFDSDGLVPKAQGRIAHWNANEIQVPAKTRNKNKPNVQLVSVGGSIQGIHAQVFKIDDLIGEHMLDSQRQLGADNSKAENWARAAIKNIPTVYGTSRVLFVGTRYGPGDAYEWLWDDVKELYGYRGPDGEPFEEKDENEWRLYFRMAREDMGTGEEDPEGRSEWISFPGKWTHRELDKIREEDPWTYYTQICNLSTYSGLSEFIDFNLRPGHLDISEEGQMFFTKEISADDSETIYWLRDSYLVISVDPAASDRKRHANTSRSAVVVYARFWDGTRVLLDGRVGYVPTTKMFDWMFTLYKKYRRYCRATLMEMVGPFAALESPLRERERAAGTRLKLRPIRKSQGDKDANISSILEPLLSDGKLWGIKGTPIFKEFEREMMMFPGGRLKDTLDAVRIADMYAPAPNKPLDEDEEDEREQRNRRNRVGMNKTTGY